MAREKAKSGAFTEDTLEASLTKKGVASENSQEVKLENLRFDKIRKIPLNLEESFRDSLEAIERVPKQTRSDAAETLAKDLAEKFQQGERTIDAWFLIKQNELAALRSEEAISETLFTSRISQRVEKGGVRPGSLGFEDVRKVLPGLERLFQDNQKAIKQVIKTASPTEATLFIQKRTEILEHELHQAKGIVDAWFAEKFYQIATLQNKEVSPRVIGSIVVDQPVSTAHKRAAELSREQPQALETAPLVLDTVPFVEDERKIDSDFIALENSIAVLSAAVIKGAKSGMGFLKDIQEKYTMLEDTTTGYFNLREAIQKNYKGKQSHDARFRLESSGSSLRKLVSGIKALTYFTETLKGEIGKANVVQVEAALVPLRAALDQKFMEISMSVGSTASTQWSGSRRLLPHPKTGK